MFPSAAGHSSGAVDFESALCFFLSLFRFLKLLQVCPSDNATQDWSDADGSGKLSRKELEGSLEMIKRQEMARENLNFVVVFGFSDWLQGLWRRSRKNH